MNQVAPAAERSAVMQAAPRLRVAMFVDRFPVISETFVVNQIVGLLERGHEVDIYSLTAKKPHLGSVHPDVSAYGLIGKTRYATAGPRQPAAFLRAGLAEFAGVLANAPLALLHVLHPRYGRNAAFLRLLSMASLLRQGAQYDVVHCQFGTVARAVLALYRSRLLSGALVTTFRGSDISLFIQRRGERVYDPLFAAGDWFLTNCVYFENRLRRLGCDASRLEVLYSGIDCRKFPFRARTWEAGRPVRLITIGRLVEKKGIEYSVDAVARLRDQGLAVEYRIVGDGELRGRIERQIATLKLGHVVSLLGARNHREIVELLDASDILLAPSVRAANGDEDAPVNVIKEAMAMGLPVVATRHGGIPELVREGISGWLVDERDAGALASSVAHLLERGHEWPRVAAAGRAFLEQHFQLDRLNDRLEQIYRRAIAHRKHRLELMEPSWTPNALS
jgi:colanic acid/amylovoran biosynthesis glycosyltransferase